MCPMLGSASPNLALLSYGREGRFLVGRAKCTSQQCPPRLSAHDRIRCWPCCRKPQTQFDTALVKCVTTRVFDKPLEALSTSLKNEVRLLQLL